MGSHRVAFPGMFAKDSPLIDIIKVQWQPIHPIFLLYMLSLLTQHCSKSLTKDVAVLPIPQLIGLVV